VKFTMVYSLNGFLEVMDLPRTEENRNKFAVAWASALSAAIIASPGVPMNEVMVRVQDNRLVDHYSNHAISAAMWDRMCQR